MKGKRIFDRFGFNLPKQLKVKNQKTLPNITKIGILI